MVGQTLQGGHKLVLALTVLLIDVRHGARFRPGAHVSVQLADLVPDLCLVASDSHFVVEGEIDAVEQLPFGTGLHVVAGFLKNLAAVGPASRLGAANRDGHFGFRGDEDGGVEHSVLFCPPDISSPARMGRCAGRD
jgi:hypothetical protein